MKASPDVPMQAQPRDKTFAEFFAGIGLVHMGLQGTGWRCTYANDIEPKKKAMYEAQFGPSPYYHVEDIWRADEVLSRLPGKPFLATASFPCVDLSIAGHWRGFEGEHSSTYFGFLDVVRRMGAGRPKLVMLENVYGFLTSHGGKDFQRAVHALAELGYWIDAIVLDAVWFVPQSRPRMFVFGFGESLDSPLVHRRQPGFMVDDPWRRAISRSVGLRPAKLLKVFDEVALPTGWATLDYETPEQCPYHLIDYLDLDDAQDWWTPANTLKHYMTMEPPSRGRVDAFIKAKATAAGTAFRRTRREKTRTEVRFDMAGCLRTPKGGSARQIVVAVIEGKLKMRWMSDREYARLQGAGDFTITVPPLQALYGFGDAVCVPAIRWIDQHILTPVFESHRASTASPATTAISA